MKRIAILILLVLMSIPSFSQERISSAELDRKDSFSAKEVSFSSKNDKVTVQYILQENAYVELYVSLDGGENYYGPLNELSGTRGNVRKSSVTRFIDWNPVKEFGGIESNAVTFRVVTSPWKDRAQLAQLKREKPKKVFSHENAIWAGLNFGFSGTLGDDPRERQFFPLGLSAGINNIAASRLGSFVTVNYLHQVFSDNNNFSFSVSFGPVFRIADRWYMHAGPVFDDIVYRPKYGALLGTSCLLSEHLSFSFSVSASAVRYSRNYWYTTDKEFQLASQIGLAWFF